MPGRGDKVSVKLSQRSIVRGEREPLSRLRFRSALIRRHQRPVLLGVSLFRGPVVTLEQRPRVGRRCLALDLEIAHDVDVQEEPEPDPIEEAGYYNFGDPLKHMQRQFERFKKLAPERDRTERAKWWKLCWDVARNWESSFCDLGPNSYDPSQRNEPSTSEFWNRFGRLPIDQKRALTRRWSDYAKSCTDYCEQSYRRAKGWRFWL